MSGAEQERVRLDCGGVMVLPVDPGSIGWSPGDIVLCSECQDVRSVEEVEVVFPWG